MHTLKIELRKVSQKVKQRKKKKEIKTRRENKGKLEEPFIRSHI